MPNQVHDLIQRVYRHNRQLKMGLLKKAASGVLALFPCSRRASTLRAQKGLRPCWTDFFDHSRRIEVPMALKAFSSLAITLFNSPKIMTGTILSNVRYFQGPLFVTFCLALFAFPVEAKAFASGEQLVKSQCVSCHRIEGKPMPRSSKKAPDLIWAGSKYQRTWLVRWLQGPKEKLYPVGYDFNFKRKRPHMAIPAAEAEKVANFLSTLKDTRVTESVMKPGTPQELSRGKHLYREHGCQNCHRTPAKNKRGYTGGTSSTSLVNMGNRLQSDWVYRFNLNPNDFVPESGAYIPNPLLPDSDIYAITTYMMTFGKEVSSSK